MAPLHRSRCIVLVRTLPSTASSDHSMTSANLLSIILGRLERILEFMSSERDQGHGSSHVRAASLAVLVRGPSDS